MRSSREPSSLVDRAWAAVLSLLALSFGVRLASSWLGGAMPLLFVLAGLVSVFWLIFRHQAGRRPWQGGPWG